MSLLKLTELSLPIDLALLKPLELEVRLPRPLRTSRNGGGCKSCWGLNFSSTDLLFCVDEEGAGKKLFFVVFNGLGIALEPLNEDRKNNFANFHFFSL